MNHLQIAYFLTVAKYCSFSEASRQLFVAQSAVSKQIQTLETSLGMKLFIRSNRAIALTPAGEILYNELQKYNDWLIQIVDMAKQVDQGKAGVFNIAVLHGLDLSGTDIDPFIGFFELYPGIQINMQRVKLQDASHVLHIGTQDMLITFSFIMAEMHDTESVVIKNENDQIIVSRAHPLGKIKNVKASDFNDYPLVTISPEISRLAYQNSLNYLHGIGVSPQRITHVPTIEDIMLSVEFGLGYGVISDSSRLSHYRESILFIGLYEEGKGPVTDILAIWREDCMNPSVKLYAEYARNIYSINNSTKIIKDNIYEMVKNQ